jgi:bilin biosynthesis protein
MDKRFVNLFDLTEAEAIALLDTPTDQLGEDDSRYVAVSHLINFPSEGAIAALVRAVNRVEDNLENRIVRRKALESLGRLKAVSALPVMQACLTDEDNYAVENAVWAIAEIGGSEPAAITADLLEQVSAVLTRPGQTYRVVIQTLAALNYLPALERIRPWMQAEDKPIASAAIAAVCRLTRDNHLMPGVVELLQDSNVYARRLCIQDLIDTGYYPALPEIAACPVSLVFRLRGLRLLAESGLARGAISFAQVQPLLDQVLRDHPEDINLVHEYDQPPSLEFLMRELYETDFGRCYLATQTVLEAYPEQAPQALQSTYDTEAYADYGAHYHVIKLWGWLRHRDAYDLLALNLNHPQPQFQKSRAAAALALAELEDPAAIPLLKSCLDTRIWDLRYATLMALEKLGDRTAHAQLAEDPDLLLRSRATMPVIT